MAAQLLTEALFVAKEEHSAAMLASRSHRTSNLGAWRGVATHGVKGDYWGHYSVLFVASAVLAALGGTTTRPPLAGPYQPQAEQARCGTRAAPQLGQGALAGGANFIHCARRESRRALDCLLF
jgi:hypothetical protein